MTTWPARIAWLCGATRSSTPGRCPTRTRPSRSWRARAGSTSARCWRSTAVRESASRRSPTTEDRPNDLRVRSTRRARRWSEATSSSIRQRFSATAGAAAPTFSNASRRRARSASTRTSSPTRSSRSGSARSSWCSSACMLSSSSRCKAGRPTRCARSSGIGARRGSIRYASCRTCGARSGGSARAAAR